MLDCDQENFYRRFEAAVGQHLGRSVASLLHSTTGIAAIAGVGIPLFSKNIPFVASAFATLVAVIMIWLAIKNAIIRL